MATTPRRFRNRVMGINRLMRIISSRPLIPTTYDTQNLVSRTTHRSIADAPAEAAAMLRTEPSQGVPLVLDDDYHVHADLSPHFSRPTLQPPCHQWQKVEGLGITHYQTLSPVVLTRPDSSHDNVDKALESRFSWSTRATTQAGYDHTPLLTPPVPPPAKHTASKALHHDTRNRSQTTLSRPSVSATDPTDVPVIKVVPVPVDCSTLRHRKRSHTVPTTLDPAQERASAQLTPKRSVTTPSVEKSLPPLPPLSPSDVNEEPESRLINAQVQIKATELEMEHLIDIESRAKALQAKLQALKVEEHEAKFLEYIANRKAIEKDPFENPVHWVGRVTKTC